MKKLLKISAITLLTFFTSIGIVQADPKAPTDENFINAVQKALDNSKRKGVCFKVEGTAYGGLNGYDFKIANSSGFQYEKPRQIADYFISQNIIQPSDKDSRFFLYKFTNEGKQYIADVDNLGGGTILVYHLCSGQDIVENIIQASVPRIDEEGNTFVTVFASVATGELAPWTYGLDFEPRREIKRTLYLMHNGWVDSSLIRR